MINSRPIKIALGDLRHKTTGKHSSFMPIGIGFIASYALAQIDDPKDVEIRLYTDPDKILRDINVWQPEIIALANYCWNSELARLVFRYAKKKNPETICVAGGPNFPVDKRERGEFLKERPEIDLYIYFEGEIAFTNLIKKILEGVEISQLKSEPQGNIVSINPKTNELVFGEPLPRLMNLDEIPSPYLNGLMDQWFDGSYAPCIETIRGCPFTCKYCFIGSQQYYKNLATFSVERIKQELTYIAQKISKYPDILLAICDSNFGMYEHDEEIARHIRSLQDEFNWPNIFDVNTGKTNHDRILKIATSLQNKMPISTSVQSLNPKTLEIIERKNSSLDEYRKINAEIKKRGMRSVTEAIMPMPEETKKSFLEGLRLLTDVISVDRVFSYTLMLLRGTYLASEEYRKKYQFKTKFRIVPRQFGEYFGEKCFEIEEVCVATNTMPFNDYLDVRGFSLVLEFFMKNQFDIIHRHLKELGIKNYDYIYYLWELIKSEKTSLSEIYNRFIKEAETELWDSPKAIYDYFNIKENYNKLLTGQLGDNLLRKYTTEMLLEKCIPSIELAYSSLEKMASHFITEEIRQSLSAAKNWTIALRNVGTALRGESHIDTDKTLSLPYDIHRWYFDGFNSSPLINYKKPVNYRIFCDAEKCKMILAEAKKVYGGDFSFVVGKLLVNRDIQDFWCQSEAENQHG